MMKKFSAAPYLLLLLAVLFSLPYILESRIDFDGDEAVVGLMALHITRGRVPVYYYGQGYMGSLEAILAAGFFFLLGPSPSALRLAPFTFYLLFLLLQFKLISAYKDRSHALLTIAYTVIFSPVVNLWATKARGGFTAVLFWGTLGYIVFFRTMDTYLAGDRRGWKWAIISGAVAAVSFWHYALVGYYYLPVLMVVIYFICKDRTLRDLIRGAIVQTGNVGAWLGRQGWPVKCISGLMFGAWVLWIVFSLVALLRGSLVIVVAGVRISSHHGVRDLGRAILSAGVFLALIQSWRWGWRTFFRRFYSTIIRLLTDPPVVTAAALVLIPLFFITAADSLSSFVPGSEGAAGRTLGTATGPGDLVNTFRIIFSQLIPYITSLRWCFAGTSPVVRLNGVIRASLMSTTLAGAVAMVMPRLFSGLISRTRRLEAFFLTSLLGSLAILGLSGTVLGRTSFRYLIPVVSWMPYLYAFGVIKLIRISRPAGLIVGTVIMISHIIPLLPIYDIYRDLAAGRQRDSIPEAIIRILDEEQVDRVYADYWIAYPITFFSEERIIAAPILSPDRYPPYTRVVEASERKAYVFEARRSHRAASRMLIDRYEREGRRLSFHQAPGRWIMIVSP